MMETKQVGKQYWSYSSFLFVALVLLTLLRLFFATQIELSPDEAYYKMWSQRLDASYYSKGPGIAVAMRLSQSIAGDGVLGIRLFAPILALGSSWLLWLLGCRLFDKKVAMLAVVFLNLTPIFNIGSLLMTIDPLSIFFWLLTMVGFERTLQQEAGRGSGWWLLTGLALGLGFLCKYTSAFQLASILLFLLMMPEGRAALRSRGIVVLSLAFLLCATPILFWNAQHGWITFIHLSERGSVDQGFSINPGEWFQFFTTHFGIYSPLFFVGLLWVLIAGVRFWSKKSAAERFLLAFALPILVVYFILSLNKAGQPNWTAPGFISLALLLANWWMHTVQPSTAKKVLQVVAIAFAIVLSLLPLHTDLLRAADIDRKVGGQLSPKLAAGWVYEKDPSKRTRGWQSSADQVAELIQKFSKEQGEDVFLVAKRYQTAAQLGHYLPADLPVIHPDKQHPRIYAMALEQAKNQFSFWPSYIDKNGKPNQQFQGANALFFTNRGEKPRPPKELREQFTRTELYSQFEVQRRGRPLRSWQVFACYDFLGEQAKPKNSSR